MQYNNINAKLSGSQLEKLKSLINHDDIDNSL